MITVRPHESYILESETDYEDKQMQTTMSGRYGNYEGTMPVKKTERHYFRHGIKFECKFKRKRKEIIQTSLKDRPVNFLSLFYLNDLVYKYKGSEG